MQFKEWLKKEETLLEHMGSPASKQGLYPQLYTAIASYAPSDVITWSSDAFTYMGSKDRKLRFNWGQGMLSKPDGVHWDDPIEEEENDTTLAKFKWKKLGMQSKPDDLIYNPEIIKSQSTDKHGKKLHFTWGQDMLSDPGGLSINKSWLTK